jgi:hypothetical protein
MKNSPLCVGLKVGLFIIAAGLLLMLAFGLLQDSLLGEICGFPLAALCFPALLLDYFPFFATHSALSFIMQWVGILCLNGSLWGLLVSGYLCLETWWVEHARRRHAQPQVSPGEFSSDADRKVIRRMLVSLIAIAFFGFYAMPNKIPTYGGLLGLTALEWDLLLLPPIIALCFSSSRSPSRWWLYYGLLCCGIIIPALNSYIFHCDSGRRPWAGLDHDWQMKLRVLLVYGALAPFLIAWTKSVLIKARKLLSAQPHPDKVDPATSAVDSHPK